MKKFTCLVVCLLFICMSLVFSGNAKGKNKSALISHSNDEIIVQFNLDSYDLEKVPTSNGDEVVIKSLHAGRILKEGAPDLEKFSTAVIIPDQGKMAIEVIDGQYIEFENIKIAPSKGNLLRTQDPATIPFTYGNEYRTNAFFPGILAELGKSYIARDFRGQPVLLYPFQYNPTTGILRVYSQLTVKVNKTAGKGENEFSRSKAPKFNEMVSEFKKVYSRHFINYDAMENAETAEAEVQYTPLQDPMGRMLIVCYNGFLTNMANFVSYKQSIGYTVDLVDYSTIGSSTALKTYVSNYYNTNGLTYLLLVGDHAQVPTSSTSAGDSDNNYGYIVGSDHYLDIFVGRFSATTTDHVDTQVNRTIWYERDLSSTATWFNKATGMGSSEGPGHNNEYDYQHVNNILTDLSNYGYTTYTNHQSGGTAANLSSLINGGQGTLWYCGHGDYDGWYCGWSFTNTNVAALTNDYMLPAIFSVACQVGNFKNYTCFCEYWLRETNGSNPAGAIAHAGSTINQSWTPPMDAQDEMADLLVSTSGPKRTFGGVFVNGLFKMIDINGSGGESMADTWTCFGDSSVQLRTPGTPEGPGSSGPTPPTANFTASTTNATIGGSVTFTDTSTGSPTSWSWTFEGGTPATSTVQNPTVTYNTAGTYDVSLTAINSEGSDSEAKVDYITVSSAPTYCSSSGSSQSRGWISGVQLSNINNSSSASTYTDFTSITGNLTKGTSYTATLTPGYSGTAYTEYWRVWIDLNHDGDFLDTGEQLISTRGKRARTASFTVPTTALTGTTRMRVSMKYGAYPTACETFSYGEVEDYTVNIQ